MHNNPVNATDPTGMIETMTELEVSVGALTEMELQASLGATALLTSMLVQKKLSIASLAKQHGAIILKTIDLYQREFDDGYRYFIHGTSTNSWRNPDICYGFKNRIKDNDFGLGLYTFPLFDEYGCEKWDSVHAAVDYAHERSKGGKNGNPILVVVRFKEETYQRLTKLKLLTQEEWEPVINARKGINRKGYMGYDEIIGFHSDPDSPGNPLGNYPIQHKFEPSGILKGMEIYAMVPLSPYYYAN